MACHLGCNKKITGKFREELVRLMVAGELTRREAAGRAGVAIGTVTSWLEVRGLTRLVPRDLSRHVPVPLRKRLAAHLLAGEITYAEAAVFADCTPGAIRDWPEIKNKVYRTFRDAYLRKLLPDLAKGCPKDRRKDRPKR